MKKPDTKGLVEPLNDYDKRINEALENSRFIIKNKKKRKSKK